MGAGAVADLPDRDEFLRRWSALHLGLAPSWLVRRWLSLCFPLARVLARLRVPPNVITLTALASAIAVPAVAAGERNLLLLAAVLVVISGVLDNLDGAVAAITDQATAFGAVLDSVADRLADTAYVITLWVLGAPGWLAGLVAGAAALQEYVRARAAGAGMRAVGVVTVAERPTRVIMVAALLVGVVVVGHAAVVATAGAVASLALAVVGLTQVLIATHRALG